MPKIPPTQAMFTDAMQFRHNRDTFFVDFLQSIGPENLLHLNTFAMSPLAAKRMLHALQENVRRYEQQFGHIRDMELIASPGPEAS